jgi:Ca-activated chloride channel family protein
MDAADIEPSRLVRAKREILDLLALAQGDRLGLLAFAGIGFVQCPLTNDYPTLKLFLEGLNTGTIPSQGTSLTSVMSIAEETFARSTDALSEGRAVLILTDGEDQGSEPVQQAKQLLAKGIRVFILGIGTPEGAPIPDLEGGFKKDEQGQLILSRLDEAGMRSIAEAGGGRYVRSVAGEEDLDLLWTQDIKSTLAQQERQGGMRRVYQEHYHWLLWAFLVLFLLDSWIPFTKKLRHAVFFVILAVSPLGSERLLADSGDLLRQGQLAYEQERWEDALAAYLAAETEQPLDAVALYNRAVAQYRLGQYADASKAFEQIKGKEDQLPPGSGELAKKSHFNAANSLAMQRQWDPAIEAYQSYLERYKDDKPAMENLAWALKQREKEQQKQDEQKQDEQKQDEQKQDEQKEAQNDKDQDKQEKGDQGNGGKPEDQSQPDSPPSPSDGAKPDQSGEETAKKPEAGQPGEEPKPDVAAESTESSKPQNSDPSPGSAENKESQIVPGMLSKDAAERLLRRLGQQGGQIRVPVPNGEPRQSHSEKDW